jgi:hypothetical protein
MFWEVFAAVVSIESLGDFIFDIFLVFGGSLTVLISGGENSFLFFDSLV